MKSGISRAVSLSIGRQTKNRPEKDLSFDKTFTQTRQSSTAQNRKAWRVTMALSYRYRYDRRNVFQSRLTSNRVWFRQTVLEYSNENCFFNGRRGGLSLSIVTNNENQNSTGNPSRKFRKSGTRPEKNIQPTP